MSYKMRIHQNWLRQASLLKLILMFFMSASSFRSVFGQPSQNSVLLPSPTKYNNAMTTKEALHRRLMREREVIPPMSSNAIPGEPSCDELRAMWRYYKRQSRAELTNEIPQFGSNMFWDILPVAPQQPQMSSFGSVKGRSKAQRLRMKTQKNPVYGQIMFKPEKERDRSRKPRPMEQIAKLVGKSSKPVSEYAAATNVDGGEVGGTPKSVPPPEPIVHLSPPATPTKESSLQKIKDVFREERIREKGPAMRQIDDNGKAFGRIILSPPRGMDGRVANKPRELMTPFEKIRFGHADDILDDETTRPNLNFMTKRRNLPIPVLKYQLQRNKQTLPYSRSSRSDGFFGRSLDIFYPVMKPHSPSMQLDTFPGQPATTISGSPHYNQESDAGSEYPSEEYFWGPIDRENERVSYHGNAQGQPEPYQYTSHDAPPKMVRVFRLFTAQMFFTFAFRSEYMGANTLENLTILHRRHQNDRNISLYTLTTTFQSKVFASEIEVVKWHTQNEF
jgi:hypothetical protein